MKKSLVLAMAMALGVTASAYAANPFSDVPTGHWAYDSISKLAAAGVIEGYGDSTFGGDKMMTRYEMAQIVAKAMAKGANVDKLAAEFADELDNLGVRVANLEKKADNVKISGNIRTHYASYKDGAKRNGSYGSKLRTRLFVNGQINDDWSYTGRLENIQNFRNNTGDEDTKLNWAFVTGKLGGMKVRAGHTWIYLGDGNIYDENIDGVVLSYGKDVKLEAVYGKPTGANDKFGWNYDYVAGASLSGNIDKLNLSAGYYRFDASDDKTFESKGTIKNIIAQKIEDNSIWHAGANYTFGKANLGASYYNTDMDSKYSDEDGYSVQLSYGKARANKVGSFGLVAQYMDLPAGVTIAHTMNGDYPFGWTKDAQSYGFEGYKLAGYYTVAKNMVLGVEYYDLEPDNNEKDYKTLWSQMIITF